MVDLELVYCPAVGPIFHIFIKVHEGKTVRDVLEQSGVFEKYPETLTLPVGIFSQPVSMDHPVSGKDRIEIYRPLTSSPKEKRRQRAR